MTVLPRSLVFVVDDDSSARTRLTNLLRARGYAVAAFDNAEAFLARTPEAGACCLVLNLVLPDLDGLDLQRHLAASGRREEIVFTAAAATVAQGIQAMKQGAVDFLIKPFGDEAVLSAVAEALVRSASLFRQRGEVARLLARIATLTPREVQVFRLVIGGLLNKQVADELGTAIQTVKIHRSRVMHKLGVNSIADLVRLAETANVHPTPRQLRPESACRSALCWKPADSTLVL